MVEKLPKRQIVQDAFNVFMFVADNSNVEWALSGLRNGGKMDYILNTINEKTAVNRDYLGKNRLNMVFDVHSHVTTNDASYVASGYGLYSAGLTEGGSDADFMDSLFQSFKEAQKRWTSEYPRLYFYHTNSNGLYHYNHQTDSEYVGKVGNSKGLIDFVTKHRIKLK